MMPVRQYTKHFPSMMIINHHFLEKCSTIDWTLEGKELC